MVGHHPAPLLAREVVGGEERVLADHLEADHEGGLAIVEDPRAAAGDGRRILQDGVTNLDYPWIVASVFGGMVAVLLLVTFVGEAVREAFDPKKFTTYR